MQETNFAIVTGIVEYSNLTGIPIPSCLKAVLREYAELIATRDLAFNRFVLISDVGQKLLMNMIVIDALVAGRIDDILFEKDNVAIFGEIAAENDKITVRSCAPNDNIPLTRQTTKQCGLTLRDAMSMLETHFSGSRMGLVCCYTSNYFDPSKDKGSHDLVKFFIGGFEPGFAEVNRDNREYITQYKLISYIRGLTDEESNRIIKKALDLILSCFFKPEQGIQNVK